MKTLIIDDERLARKELISLLEPYTEIEIVDEAINVDDALEKISKHNPELIFLDIQMPGKSGFDLLEELDKVPKVIFTTAYDEYAIKAFDFNALDYLLKPIQEERLKDSIQKLLTNQNSTASSDEKKEEPRKLTVNDQVFVKDGDKCWFVKLENNF
jgi:two-component system LytT family response regulator